MDSAPPPRATVRGPTQPEHREEGTAAGTSAKTNPSRTIRANPHSTVTFKPTRVLPPHRARQTRSAKGSRQPSQNHGHQREPPPSTEVSSAPQPNVLRSCGKTKNSNSALMRRWSTLRSRRKTNGNVYQMHALRRAGHLAAGRHMRIRPDPTRMQRADIPRPAPTAATGTRAWPQEPVTRTARGEPPRLRNDAGQATVRDRITVPLEAALTRGARQREGTRTSHRSNASYCVGAAYCHQLAPGPCTTDCRQ